MTAAKSLLIDRLVCLAVRFCAARERSRASVSKELFGRGGHLDDLEAGRRDLTTGSFERSIDWFDANWPDDLPWPVLIERPSERPEAAE